MTHRKLILLLFIFLICIKGEAQIVPSITGYVIDEETNVALSRVHIVIKSKDSNVIIAFCQSSVNGQFVIKKDVDISACYMELSHIGYSTKKIELNEQNFPIKIKLSPSNTKLKEVIIVPQKVRTQGDTIIYNVASFSVAQDRSIADVLERMPGIKIEKSGEITYQGEKLNKFYIEGSDMLGGRYNLATNNISHQDVSSVEVMENHQPVRAFEGLIISTQPAINIKLKEKAKSRWAGNIKGEAGIPSIWNVEALAMRFRKSTQTLNTYKGNNLGKTNTDFNFFSSIGDFDFMNSEPTTYINVAPSTTSNIEQNRYRFNQQHNLSNNNLFKLSNEFDLVTEIILSRDKQTYNSASRIDIFLDNDTIIREDKEDDARQLSKQIEAKLKLKGNKKKYYLNNELKFNLNFKENNLHTQGTYPNSQYADIDSKQLSNDFNILRRFGKRIINFRSFNEYAKKPQLLTVSKEGAESIRQNIDLSSFTSNNSADYSFSLNSKFRIAAKASVLFESRQMTNKLDMDESKSDMKKSLINLIPSITYNSDIVSAVLRLPLYYQHMKFDALSKQYQGINPSLFVKWILSSSWELSSNLSVSKQLPQGDLFYNGYVQNNYRMKSRGYINFDTGRSLNSGLTIKYKDVIKLLFINGSFSYRKGLDKKISNQDFEGDYIINYYYPHNTYSNVYQASGNISKWVGLINGTVALNLHYRVNESDLMRNDIIMPYKSNSIYLSTRIDSKLEKWGNLTYRASFSNNKLSMDGSKKSNYSQFEESLDFAFHFISELQLKLSIAHYCNEIANGKYKNFVFADISTSYLLNEKVELLCTLKNIFNSKKYSYTIESNQVTSYHEYKLRPFNILIGATYHF